MKNSAVITQLLFQEEEKCSNACIAANSILCGDSYPGEKVARILDRPGNIHIISVGEEGEEQKECLNRPCLFECKFADVRKVIAATFVACAEETHNFVNSLYHYSQSPPCTLDFRNGCVFGLLDVLNHNKVFLTCEGVCDFYKELGNCTPQSAVMLLILELLWQRREGDALPPEKAGELTNLIGEYMDNEGSGWFKSSVRMDSLRNFLKRACALYKKESNSFPSKLADAVVTTFVYQTIKVIPKSKLLQLASEAVVSAD